MGVLFFGNVDMVMPFLAELAVGRMGMNFLLGWRDTKRKSYEPIL